MKGTMRLSTLRRSCGGTGIRYMAVKKARLPQDLGSTNTQNALKYPEILQQSTANNYGQILPQYGKSRENNCVVNKSGERVLATCWLDHTWMDMDCEMASISQMCTSDIKEELELNHIFLPVLLLCWI